MANCLIKDNKFYTPSGEESRLYKDLEQKVGEQEAREMFILSHTPSFQKEVKSKTKEAFNSLIPRGSTFKETNVNGIRTFHIYVAGEKIGRIQLKKYKEGFKVKSSLVNEDKKGMGFGKALYAYTLYKLSGEGKTLYTDTTRTEDADRIWESLKKENLTSDAKTAPPIANIFYENGEVKADVVINYANDNFSTTEPLTKEEVLDLSALQIAGVETSDELYEVLYDAFYNNGVFDPNVKKMEKIYTEAEVRNILEDVEIQARILETIEKLRHTEEFNVFPIKVDAEFSYKDLTVNVIGQYKANNPLQDKVLYEEQNGGEGFVQVDVIDENGNAVENKLIYDNAVKVVDDPKILQAIDAIIQAPNAVDTSKVEKKVQKWLLDYGLDITNLLRENYRALAEFIRIPTEENTILLEQALGFNRTLKQPFVRISPANRTYKMLRTTKSEQQLFDELSLIKTNTPNIYHRIEKIDEQEMRDIQENQDLTVPVYQLYKEYFEYRGVNDVTSDVVNDVVNVEYLTGDFVADFAAERLKNPNNEFYQQFKINENGIELISQDELTIAKVKSQIENYPQLADYSIVSKSLPNLKEATPKTFEDKDSRRVQAVNNKEAIPAPKAEITILDETFITSENETEEFIKIGEEVYEMQEQGVYAKLTFEENPSYYTMNVEAPPYKLVEQKQANSAEKAVKKLTTKQQDEENFDCN